MKVHHDITHLPEFKNAVMTIGTFDGVHMGHRQILNQLKKEAMLVGGETLLITFHPHPRKVVSNKHSTNAVLLINTIEEKINLLEKAGIDHLVIIPFTEEFSKQSARDYVEQFLIQKFHPLTIIIGYDHRFGASREGNFSMLEKYALKGKFKLQEIPAQLLRENSISSTRVREALINGTLEEANELLGYQFFFKGKVVEGNKLGRTIGYPTANLDLENEEKIVPANGVYAVKALLKKEDVQNEFSDSENTLNGMMNIGFRPTVGGQKRVIEVNLFDFNEMIYGRYLEIHLVAFLRKEKAFNGLEALKEQLGKDRDAARKLLAR